MNKIQQITWMLKQFRAMGATPTELITELHTLYTNQVHFTEWWCTLNGR